MKNFTKELFKSMLVEEILDRIGRRVNQISNSADEIEEFTGQKSDDSDYNLEEKSRMDATSSVRANSVREKVKKSSSVDELASRLNGYRDKKYESAFGEDVYKGMGEDIYKLALVNQASQAVNKDSYPKSFKDDWEALSNTSVGKDGEHIDTPFKDYPAGTHREDIWHDMEDKYKVSIGDYMSGKPHSGNKGDVYKNETEENEGDE